MIKFNSFPLTGAFYFTLGNIRPAYRSTLQAIQLVAVAHAKDVHHKDGSGAELLLSNFVDALNKLSSVSTANNEFYQLLNIIC